MPLVGRERRARPDVPRALDDPFTSKGENPVKDAPLFKATDGSTWRWDGHAGQLQLHAAAPKRSAAKKPPAKPRK